MHANLNNLSLLFLAGIYVLCIHAKIKVAVTQIANISYVFVEACISTSVLTISEGQKTDADDKHTYVYNHIVCTNPIPCTK